MIVTLPQLHEGGQRQVKDDLTRFKVLACGRRWGKTRLGAAICIATAVTGGRAWWVAPSYKMAAVGWRGIRLLGQQIPGAEVRIVDRLVALPGGGWVQVRSADDPQSLRGEGLDFVVLDECAFMKEAAWNEALRPALSDRQGKALFISTPKGRNWFWRLWQQRDGTEWKSWRFETATNPHILPEEIEAARENLPERIYRQEYLAEFMDDAGGVFRRVIDAAIAKQQEKAEPGHEYIFGLDWGKNIDFTAIAVWDSTQRAQVYLDRFNKIDYTVQVGRVKALYEKFRPRTIVAERNSMGDPLVEQLQREGLPVQPFTTTNASKAQIMDKLALAFERNEIEIIPDPVLINELQAYEMKRLPSGMFRYSAPAGMHDDTVMALALAYGGGSTWSFG